MAEKKKTKREQAETAAKMWKEGKTPQEISETMGLSRDYVLALLTHDPDYKNRPKEFELRRERVRKYAEDDEPVKEMAAKEGVSEDQIYAILKKLGIERKTKNEKQPYILPDGFDWKWAITTNRLLKTGKKELHPVPKHSKKAEKAYWEG